MRHASIAFVASAICVAAPQLFAPAWSAGANSCGTAVDAEGEWDVSVPEQAGLDPATLCALTDKLENSPNWNVHSVVVVRTNKLVYETYGSGEDYKWGTKLGVVAYTAQMQHDVRSVSKSVVSLLVGITLDRNLLVSVDEPVFTFFPEHTALRTPEKDGMQLHHLLSMTSGFGWQETLPYSSPNNSERLMHEADDPYRFVLEQPLRNKPGEKWNYNGGNTMLLGAVLRKVTGQPLVDFAAEALFEPLGITEFEWVGLKKTGEPAAHGGLRLRPRDMAKIGQLILDNGKWNGRQIVSEKWIEDSTEPLNEGWFPHRYGYQWWIGNSKIGAGTIEWIAGWGLGGQRIYIVPEYELVVVITAGLYFSDAQTAIVLNILDKYVLAAVRN